MKALEIKHQRLQPCERPLPSPGKGEVLIRVHAAGINRADLLQVKGLYPPPEGTSDIPGMEVSGMVEALGKDVSNVAVGDAVCALLPGGGYAEYALAAEALVLPIPHSISLTEAASLPEACFTVWKNLYVLAQLQRGERVLIHSGASGIGVTAIQIASALGAEVYATAGSEEKCRTCEKLGAKKAVNYTTQPYVAIISTLTNGNGVDVILDVLGGGTDFQDNLSIMAQHGRMVTIALLSGKNTELNLAPLLLKSLTLFGSTLRSDDLTSKALLAKALLTHIWPLYANGRIKPVVDSVFPLEDAEIAHQRMKSRQHTGKIVLLLNHGL